MGRRVKDTEVTTTDIFPEWEQRWKATDYLNSRISGTLGANVDPDIQIREQFRPGLTILSDRIRPNVRNSQKNA